MYDYDDTSNDGGIDKDEDCSNNTEDDHCSSSNVNTDSKEEEENHKISQDE